MCVVPGSGVASAVCGLVAGGAVWVGVGGVWLDGRSSGLMSGWRRKKYQPARPPAPSSSTPKSNSATSSPPSPPPPLRAWGGAGATRAGGAGGRGAAAGGVAGAAETTVAAAGGGAPIRVAAAGAAPTCVGAPPMAVAWPARVGVDEAEGSDAAVGVSTMRTVGELPGFTSASRSAFISAPLW